MRTSLLFGLFLAVACAEPREVDQKYLKCLVCRAIMKEMENEMLKYDPHNLVYSYLRTECTGNKEVNHCKVPLNDIKKYIQDLLGFGFICEEMTNYVELTRKSHNQLTIFNLMSPSHKSYMMSEVNMTDDDLNDDDLNDNLYYYCMDIVQKFEDVIVSLYIDDKPNKEKEFCTNIWRICDENHENDEL